MKKEDKNEDKKATVSEEPKKKKAQKNKSAEITCAELKENGFIDEINRLHFNPFGLVLKPSGADSFKIVDSTIEGNQPVLVIVDKKDAIKKAAEFQAFCHERRKARKKELGFGKQPVVKTEK